MLLFFALIAGSSISWADADVTLDFTKAGTDWKIPTSGTNKDRKSFTNGDYTIYLYATTNYKANNGYLILGKKDSYLELPAFDFDVEKIEVLGHSGASASVEQNIYVGEEAVSTKTTGANGVTNSYAIASDYQAAGNIYKLVIVSNHNTQIDYIKIYKKGNGGGAETVAVTGVTVDPTEWEMEVGDTKELTATVAPAEATNKAVTWKSDDESVATVSNAGVVTAIAAGTATITVTTTDGGKTATCAITVNEPAPDPAAGPVALTFDFTDAGWGFPESYDKTEKSYTNNGYTFTLGASSNGHKAYITNGSTVSLIFGKKDATLTFPAFDFNVSKIKVYGYSSASGKTTFNIYVDDDAVSTEVTGSKTSQTFEIAADKQTAGTIYTLKITNDNNCQISKIEIFGYVNTTEVTAAGWASYVTPKALRFAEGEAFAVTAAGSGSVTLAEVTDVPNNFPVLLKGAGAKTAMVLETSPAAPANLLAVSTGGEINGYVLANKNDVVGFYKWAGGSLTSGKVYLPASAVAGAPDFLGFDDNATGIDEVRGKMEDVRGEYYNLAGQRVANPTKGLYIVNGKKVIIK